MLKPWLLTETTPDGGAGGDGGAPEKLTIELPVDQIPEQFRTNPESVFKSYDESRREMDRLRSQLEEERTQFASALERIESVQAPAPQPAPGENPLLAQYQQAVEAGDAAAQLAITLALNKQIMDDALETRFKTLEPKLGEVSQADRDIAFELAQNRVASSLGDGWTEIAPDVNAWLKEHSSWLPSQNSPEAFEKVIREGVTYVQGQKAAERLAALEADRAARLAAQTGTGSGVAGHSTVTDAKKQAWQEIVEAPVGSYSDLKRG